MHCQRVGLGAARSENDILIAHAKTGRDSFARVLQNAPGCAAGSVDRGRIAGHLEGRLHCSLRLRAKRLAGVGVEVKHGFRRGLFRRHAGKAARWRYRSAAHLAKDNVGQGHPAQKQTDLPAEFSPEIVGLTPLGQLAWQC